MVTKKVIHFLAHGHSLVKHQFTHGIGRGWSNKYVHRRAATVITVKMTLNDRNSSSYLLAYHIIFTCVHVEPNSESVYHWFSYNLSDPKVYRLWRRSIWNFSLEKWLHFLTAIVRQRRKWPYPNESLKPKWSLDIPQHISIIYDFIICCWHNITFRYTYRGVC